MAIETKLKLVLLSIALLLGFLLALACAETLVFQVAFPLGEWFLDTAGEGELGGAVHSFLRHLPLTLRIRPDALVDHARLHVGDPHGLVLGSMAVCVRGGTRLNRLSRKNRKWLLAWKPEEDGSYVPSILLSMLEGKAGSRRLQQLMAKPEGWETLHRRMCPEHSPILRDHLARAIPLDHPPTPRAIYAIATSRLKDREHRLCRALLLNYDESVARAVHEGLCHCGYMLGGEKFVLAWQEGYPSFLSSIERARAWAQSDGETAQVRRLDALLSIARQVETQG